MPIPPPITYSIVEYKTFTEDSASDLDFCVTGLLKEDGWQLHGEPRAVLQDGFIIHMQTMIKYERD